MVQQAIFESDAKNIIRNNLKFDKINLLPHAVVDDVTTLHELPKYHEWLKETPLVVKPDQCVKGRGLAGVVGLNIGWDRLTTYVNEHYGKVHSFGKISGILKRFIVEPYVSHDNNAEHFVCIHSAKDHDVILYSSRGGVDIGDVSTHSIAVKIDIGEKHPEIIIKETLTKNQKSVTSPVIINFITKLYSLFCELHFTYLELNPLIVDPVSSTIYIVDVAAKIDSCAEFICGKKWTIFSFPPVFGREISREETYISHLDSKSGSSLKFTILNKNGRIWTMVAGGGASVVFSDTICDLGFSHELANYGEYSGAPTLDETYEYALTLINCMLQSPKRDDGKILIIAGGIANFTNVATTFKGIIAAINETASLLLEHHVKIFVRRGGPNYEEGLKSIKVACERLEIPIYVFGIDIHMTSMVSMALGLKPITDVLQFNVCDTVSFPSRQMSDVVTSANQFHPSVNQNDIFTPSTVSILWGYQETAIQGMLDFDYLCRRKTPSVCCMIYPFRASFVAKFYFGLEEIFIPIFKTFTEATQKFPHASVLINFASMRSSYEISSEALDYPQFKVISIFAEGIPERQTQMLNRQARQKNVIILGPASIGGIKPGCFRVGHSGGIINNIVTCKLYRPGSVCYVTRSGGMSNELNNILSRITDGVYEGVHLGGDRYPGSSYLDHISRFNKDPNVELIVILGEVGGLEEYVLCDAIKSGAIKKPVVAWCIGTCSSYFSTNIQFGHANACADDQIETATAKNKALKDAGAYVPDSFDDFYNLVKRIYEERVSKCQWKVKPDISPPPIPVDFKHAKEMGLIRKPTSFISTICDDRGQEPTYSGVSISNVLNENLGIGGTIGLLWFQRRLPDYMCRFIEMCIIILADHGPAVSGAHNTIVTARAGKDMLASLCSGLLTIGDRFGGAINGAATQFWNAYRSNKTPSEFVQETRKSGQLILGIGHLIKSVTNPDERVKRLIKFVKEHLETPLLDYALEVEKITTTKKSNLILNVDGTIGVSLIDMMLASNIFSESDIKVYLELGAFNAIFILSRSIGFIGHFIDQKRLKQGLYRHPWDDISFIDGFDVNN